MRVILLFSILYLTTNVSLANPPQRIISLSPAMTEILFDLNLGDKIVGTSEHSDYPEAAKNIAIIGGYGKPNAEKIIALKPDIVLGFEEGVDNISPFLKMANIRFEHFKAAHISDYEGTLLQLAEIFSIQSLTQQKIKDWKNAWAQIAPPQKKLHVLIQVDHSPLMVAAKETFLDEVLQKCGANNTLTEKKGYLSITPEILYQRQITHIILIGEIAKTNSFNEIQTYWQKLPFTKSAKVLRAESDALARLAPRLASATQVLCRDLAQSAK